MNDGSAAPEDRAVIGVDVGGTFTDVVRWDGVRLTVAKEPSTPLDQSLGVVAGAGRIGAATRLLHGTTVATNALLQRSGAICGLVTSPGFADIIEIGRQDRPSLYDSAVDRTEPLVPRHLRFEAPDDPSGWQPPGDLAEAEAVAVSLLYGFERPDDEAAVAAAVSKALPGRPVVRSSEVAPEFREFERTVTTVLNAYLAPETAGYLENLKQRCNAAGLPEDVLVMRSSGGLIPLEEAARLPVSILLSGPAGGVVAAAALGDAIGHDMLVSFDMGGTSTDVCRIEGGRPEVTYERDIAGLPCRMPSVAVHTVGAGGGSVAWADEGGALRVGPRSAGARPGPAAYGHGGDEPTVTDADVVLGRIDGGARLAGSLPLRPGLAAVAVAGLGARIGLEPSATALGIATVVEEVMAGAIRKVSIEEGTDPRQAWLMAFGGAGGLHATSVARRLDMAGVVVPSFAGVFSALGLLLSPPRIDVARSIRLDPGTADRLGAELASIIDEARDRFRRVVATEPDQVHATADVRYVGQSHELSIPLAEEDGWPVLAERFHRTHRTRNGFDRVGDPIEVTTLRSAAVGTATVTFDRLPSPRPAGDRVTGRRPVITPSGVVDATVMRRRGLSPGDEVVGPAVVEEDEATTFLGAGERGVVHDSGALLVEW